MAAFESESGGCLRHVPAIFLQLAQDELAFVGAARLVQRGVGLLRTLGDSAEKLGGEMMRLDTCLWANDDQPFDKVAQLAHIPRPGIADQYFHRGIAEFARLLSVFGAEFIQEITRDGGDIFFAFPQRGNEEGNHV